jgi:endonuclease/exonuclease/phosphatase family metal-dependent hydrolase
VLALLARCALILLGPLTAFSEAHIPAVTLATELPPEIRVVAYNLKNWLSMERRVAGELVPEAPKSEPEKTAAVRILASLQPDILGVCEIGTRNDVADLHNRLRAKGIDLPHHLLHEAADPHRRLALLSRFPITASQASSQLHYSLDGRVLPLQRGILDATLQINPAYELRLLGCHLKSRREVQEGEQAAMRRHEAVLVREYIEQVLKRNPQTNLLLYGDFNDTKNEQPIKVVQGQFGHPHYLRDLGLHDADGYHFTYYWNLADTYDRIDFAFINNGLWPEVRTKKSFIAKDRAWLEASDHRPLVITLLPLETITRPRPRP